MWIYITPTRFWEGQQPCSDWAEIPGVMAVPTPMLYPHTPLFMLIHIFHTIDDDYISETMIMDFLKYNQRIR
jgi:hypothetical protein